MTNHILEEYKQRFLNNTDFALTSFKLTQKIQFNNTRRNGEFRPYYTEFMDEVKLEVELELIGYNHNVDPANFRDRNFHLMRWKTSISNDRWLPINTYIYELEYIIRKN